MHVYHNAIIFSYVFDELSHKKTSTSKPTTTPTTPTPTPTSTLPWFFYTKKNPTSDFLAVFSPLSLWPLSFLGVVGIGNP